ncbi:MAG: DUF885 domain-containing protein [Gemmatimonadota bacterium]
MRSTGKPSSRIIGVVLAAFLLLGGAALRAQEPDPDSELRTLLASTWDDLMRLDPEWATEVGYPDYQTEWRDRSPEGATALRALMEAALVDLRTIERDGLEPGNRIHYDVFEDFATTLLAAPLTERVSVLSSYGYTSITQMDGVHHSVSRTLRSMPRRTVADYEAIVARVRGVGATIHGAMESLRTDLRAGVALPAVAFTAVPQQVTDLAPDEALSSPLMVAFTEIPESIDETDRRRLLAAAESAYREHLRPAFTELEAFLRDDYGPATRETIGLSDVPGGPGWYAQKVRTFTTTDMTPRQIHELGLAEVARIRAAMEEVIEDSGFEGTFQDFTHFLQTDPRFYYQTAEELLAGYRDISKRADPELVPLFGILPRMPYGVKAIPDFSAPTSTTAYYNSGAHASGRPAWFYANTYNLPARPKWEMEALSLHEAVPGHHLQISIAQELSDMPEFRRHVPYNAFVEGWGLYAETLGYDMGFYQDPYSRYGQLSYQMWRAVRLVVDTGMHSFGWTRQQAIDFFAENSGKAEHDIAVEIDRYIVWPGQALGYMVGKLKIEELRRRAEDRLGDDFDIRVFHDRVLENGAVPLSVLERHIDAWLESAAG